MILAKENTLIPLYTVVCIQPLMPGGTDFAKGGEHIPEFLTTLISTWVWKWFSYLAFCPTERCGNEPYLAWSTCLNMCFGGFSSVWNKPHSELTCCEDHHPHVMSTLPASIKSADGINNFNALIKKYDFESLKFDKLASLISFKDSIYEYF